MQENIFITEEQQKATLTPSFGPLGELVDIRTYRRWLPDKLRRETVAERNARVVNYNVGLAIGKQDTNVLQQEADLMYQMLNDTKVWPSGRTAWVGGTSTTANNPAANFNCSFLAINRIEAFCDLFELLMLGTGVGFRVHSKDINKLPSIVNIPEVVFLDYVPLLKKDRLQTTLCASLNEEGSEHLIRVGDSREGWIDALRILMWIMTNENHRTRVVFDFDSVRPMGERIAGFGGTASGPDALRGIIQDVYTIFKECPSPRLRSIDAMDISCAIARGVVAGSSRRSALICLFEEGDELCATAKKGLYTDPNLAVKMYRSQSNNTENIGAADLERVKEFLLANATLDINHPKVKQFLNDFAPSVKYLQPKFETVKTEGEPAFDNWARMVMMRFYAARMWRPWMTNEEIWDNYCDIGTNPCHEIILSAGLALLLQQGVSFCNLTTVPLPNHLELVQLLTEEGDDYGLAWELNMYSLEQAFRMAARIGLRQTCVEMPKEHMSATQLDERLLGVSATGWRDVFDALGWKTGDERIAKLQRQCREWANDEATKYAEELGVPRPLLVTTIKPEGTASQIFGTGSGLHWDWAPFYIRRIRMSASDALAKTLIEQGFPCYPELYDLAEWKPEYSSIVGVTEEYWKEIDNWKRLHYFGALDIPAGKKILLESNTVVFEFPVKSLAKQSQGSVSAIEQLENMKSFTVNYCDHMPSSTITVKPEEWDEVIEWVHDNWADFTTASFLPYYGGGYPLLPNEEIDETEYESRLSFIPAKYKEDLSNGKVMFRVDEDLLRSIEAGLVDPDDVDLNKNSSCSTGLCPVR